MLYINNEMSALWRNFDANVCWCRKPGQAVKSGISTKPEFPGK